MHIILFIYISRFLYCASFVEFWLTFIARFFFFSLNRQLITYLTLLYMEEVMKLLELVNALSWVHRFQLELVCQIFIGNATRLERLNLNHFVDNAFVSNTNRHPSKLVN